VGGGNYVASGGFVFGNRGTEFQGVTGSIMKVVSNTAGTIYVIGKGRLVRNAGTGHA
jgi:hypothetical protein